MAVPTPFPVQRLVRAWSIAAGTGFLLGLFIVGLGARLAMRVSGALTAEANRDVLTEAQRSVGVITLEGSIGFILFGGLMGVAGALVYAIVRRWVPARTWRGASVLGLIGLAFYGRLVIEGDNFDFFTFGPLWLNLLMYGSLPVLYALALPPSIRFFEARLPEPPVSGPVFAIACVPVVLSLPAVPMVLAFPVALFGPWMGTSMVLAIWFPLATLSIRTRVGRSPWEPSSSELWIGRGLIAFAVLVGGGYLVHEVLDIMVAAP